MLPDTFFVSRRDQILTLAARYKLPAIYGNREFGQNGGLVGYAANFVNSYRQTGSLRRKSSRGHQTGRSTVIQPTKFELVINLKTAKALGLALRIILLVLADEVIE